MTSILGSLLDRGLALNRGLANVATNGLDWWFRSERLIKLGKTWFELVYDGDPMSVRYYALPEETEVETPDGGVLPIERNQHTVPLVLVPPLGVTANTFDLMPNRSLARYMAARGFHVYLIDWGKPGPQHAHLGFKAYADQMMGEALARVREHADVQQVSLMGWCMGGLLMMMHAGLVDGKGIRNIVTVASPVDLRGGGIVAGVAATLDAPARLIRRYSDWRLHNVNPAFLSVPGPLTALSFKLTDPIGSVTTYWDLITRLGDRDFVESHTTTANYLNKMLRYPGGVLQDMAVYSAVDNQLAQGQIKVGDKTADLRGLTMPMLVCAGETDQLVGEKVASRLLDVVASDDKTFRLIPGGHMGVILGSNACNHLWQPAADWLIPRSQAAS